jgi:hypothetical protein
MGFNTIEMNVTEVDKLKNSLSKRLLIGILLFAVILRFQRIFWGILIFDPPGSWL